MPSRISPNSRCGRLVGGLAICLAIMSGCGRKSAPAVSFFTAPRQGHVYLAQLVGEHPLYEQYRRLEQEIVALRRSCEIPVVSPVPLELGELFLPGPELPRFPLEQFERRREAWLLTLLPDRPVRTTDLAADLAAELQWRRRTVERAGLRRVAEVTAHEEEGVARVRAAAVRARQEAMNNAGLDLKLPEREAQAAAERERQRLWDEIEAETTAARAEAEQRIARASARIEAETQAQMTEAEAAAWRRMEKRLEIIVKSGSETLTGMSKAIAPPEPPAASEGIAWQPTTPPAAADFQPTPRAMMEADQRIRLAQAALLARHRAELGAALFEATALAVQRIAGLHSWNIHFPPEESATGQDMTERVRPELRRMFHPETS